MYKKIIFSGIMMLAVAAGLYIYAEKPGNAQTIKNEPPSTTQFVAVEAVKVKLGKIDRTVEAVGNLISNETVMLRPEIAGRVTKILFEEGARVEKNDLLVQLDDVIAKAELAQMQASLTLSKTNYERAKRLFAQDAESGSALDEALAKRDTDQAAVDLAQARVDRMVIRAPFDGVVGLRVISPGDYVNIGQDLVNIENLDPLKVDFRLPELYLSSLKPGQEIEVTVDAYRDRKFKGKVYAINPMVDTNGRTIVLRATLENSDMLLRPGLFARVQLALGQTEEVLLVPEEALVPEGSKQFVLKVESDRAVSTEVQTGLRRNGQVEITKGLKLEDQVVTAGQMKIRPNSKIKVIEQKKAAIK